MNLKLLHIFLFAFAIVASVSCKKKKQQEQEVWNNTTMSASVEYGVSNEELIIAGKSFIMESVKLDLSDLMLTGDRIQSAPISLLQPTSGSIQFIANSDNHGFTIPIGTYTSMELTTKLVSSGTPSVKIIGKYYFPTGEIYDIDIALSIEHDYTIALEDVDGSSTVLIEENNQKNLRITLDTDILFEDINPGLWNAANVTSNNGSETIVVNEMNNANIKNALEGKIAEALQIDFQ